MKKVGIVTLYQNNRNYGGLLQAFALQQIIQTCGFESEILNYTQNQMAYRFKRMCNLGLSRTLEVIKNKITTKLEYQKNPQLRQNIKIRNECFHEFEISIPHSVPVYDNSIKMMANKYDILVCGSDQIWNPGLWSSVMFLDIPGFEGRRFSYAASIGRHQLTKREQAFIAEHAKGLDAISVREVSAERLLQGLVQQTVKTVLDPIFLIETSVWKRIARKPEGVPEQFVFCFFLGKNADVKKRIYNKFYQNIPIVTIPHLQTGYKAEDEQYSTVKLYNIGPNEWIWLILNATCIFTDSFHGTAFSVNCNRPFFSFPKGAEGDKQAINSRLFDLLTMCGIEERYIFDLTKIEEQETFPINWRLVNEIISTKRLLAMNFLKEGLQN